MSNLPAVVSEVDARELAKVLHISHISGDVPDVNELRRAYSIMREMNLGISEVGFLTFKNKAGKVEVTVNPKAQTVFGKAIPSLRSVGVLEVCGGLLIEEGDNLVEVAGEFAKGKVVGAWAGLRMANNPKEVVAINRYATEELTSTTIGDATRKMPKHMLVLRARLWRTRELVPDAIGNLYAREEFDYNIIDQPPKTKLETLGEFQIADKKGTLHSLNELVSENKSAYWKAVFNQSATKEVAEFLTEFITVNGLLPISELDGMTEFLVDFSTKDSDLAGTIKKLITIEPPKEMVNVDGKFFPADEPVGEQWELVVQPIINAVMKPAERVPSLKSHGIKPPYHEVSWRQIAEYLDYKVIQGIKPQAAPDYSNLDAAETMQAWLELLQKKDGTGLFDNAEAIFQLAGVDESNIKSVHHELSQIVEAFTQEAITYDLPQSVNAAIQLLKRKVMK